MSESVRAEGIGGAMELAGGLLHISRSGVTGFVLHGLKGDKEIALRAISSVQFKVPNLFANGYLQVSLAGGNEGQRGIVQATRDENTLMFTKKQLPAFERLRDALRVAMTGSASAG